MATTEKSREIEAATRRARRDFYGILVAAVFFAVYGGIGLGDRMGRGFPTGFAILAIGLVVVALGAPGLIRRLEGGEAETLKRARAAESAGSMEEAEKLLDELAALSEFHWVRREARVERARIAVRSGALEQVEGHVSLALAEPMGLFGRKRSREAVNEARSLRALARAAMGNAEAALEDIVEVRRSAGKKRGCALGRAALAEAIGLERKGDRAGLKALLDREERRLEKLTRPRERALVEALRQRAREAESASVYRQRTPGSRVEGAQAAPSVDPELDAWVDQILTLKTRVAEPRVRIEVDPGDLEARAELEADEEALKAEAPRRSGPRDA